MSASPFVQRLIQINPEATGAESPPAPLHFSPNPAMTSTSSYGCSARPLQHLPTIRRIYLLECRLRAASTFTSTSGNRPLLVLLPIACHVLSSQPACIAPNRSTCTGSWRRVAQIGPSTTSCQTLRTYFKQAGKRARRSACWTRLARITTMIRR
jgi:hypothetical protein